MGESSGGGGNESDNQQDDGGRRPGDPQVFGVDGVSKTGSTSKDQQIGFTDGQGGKGANFDALQGATRQQTTAAVAAADAARNAGGGDTAAQQAVRGILDSYDPSAVNRQGNLTDSGRNLVNEAAQDALEFERVSRDQQAANIMGIMTDAPPARAPADFDSQLTDFLDAQAAEDFRAAEVAGVRAPPNIGFDITQPGITPAEAARFDAMGVVTRDLAPLRAELAALPTNILSRRLGPSLYEGETITQTPERSAALSELQKRAAAGDVVAQNVIEAQRDAIEPGITPAEFARIDAANNLSQALSGITTLPEAATADAILARNQQTQRDIQNLYDSIDVPESAGDFAGAGATAIQPPIGRSMGGANELFGGTGATAPDPLLTTGTAPGVEDSVVGGPIAATGGPMERVDPTQVGGISVPTPPPDRFKTNAQRDFFENLASLPGGQAQFDAELANLENRGFIGRRIASVISEGGVPNYDPSAPEGFRIRGATGTNFVDLPFLGTTPISTYTGLDNPNAPADTSSDEPVSMTTKAPNDPCPAGYQLINGVCQPVDDVTQAPPPPGSDFQINPTTGLPTVFQPTTVATPVGPINPFVLQPSPPVGINPPAQGIQALSPTGAALGRQV